MVDISNSREQNAPQANWIFDWGKVVFGFLVLVSAPLLYVHGTIFYHSYLEVFGLESALFAIDRESVFVKGYFVVLQMGASTIIHLLLFVVLTFGAAFSVDFLARRGKWDEAPLFSSLTAKGLAAVGGASFLAAVGIFLLALSLLTAHKYGASQAVQDAARFRSKAKEATVSHVAVKIDQKSGERVFEGYKILCSEKWCAFYVASKIEIHPVGDIRELRIDAEN